MRKIGLPLLVTMFAFAMPGMSQQPQPQPQAVVQPQPAPTTIQPAPQPLTPTEPGEPHEYSVRVSCSWHTPCDMGVSISGGTSASIELTGIPATTATVLVNTHERQGTLKFQNIPVTDGTTTLTVFKSRFFYPSYQVRNTGTNPFRMLGLGGRPAEASEAPLQVVLDGNARTIDVAVITTGGSSNFPIWVQWRPWRVETGGFFAYAFAHSQELLTQTINVDPDGTGPMPSQARTKVVRVRTGDNFGPTTGVTFFFHPGNYANVGFEFGSATSGNDPTSWFLGLGVRLLQPSDRSLLTLSAGLSRVSITTYPGVVDGTDYDPTDPLLTGRRHYTNRPYISLGLGITFGNNGTGSSGSKTTD